MRLFVKQCAIIVSIPGRGVQQNRLHSRECGDLSVGQGLLCFSENDSNYLYISAVILTKVSML